MKKLTSLLIVGLCLAVTGLAQNPSFKRIAEKAQDAPIAKAKGQALKAKGNSLQRKSARLPKVKKPTTVSGDKKALTSKRRTSKPKAKQSCA
ncbi:hypothetical protein OAF43_00670 [bacterium]|nr:hypothetical protein [bacterium]